MSMPPETTDGQPGGRRWLLIIAGVIAVAVLAYLFFGRGSGGGVSGAGGAAYSGSGGTANSTTRIDKGAVQITVTQDQPQPPVRRRKVAEGDVEVPDERGKPYRRAASDLKRHGLSAQRTQPYVGVVSSMSPWPGSKVPRGTYINLRGRPWPVQRKSSETDPIPKKRKNKK